MKTAAKGAPVYIGTNKNGPIEALGAYTILSKLVYECYILVYESILATRLINNNTWITKERQVTASNKFETKSSAYLPYAQKV